MNHNVSIPSPWLHVCYHRRKCDTSISWFSTQRHARPYSLEHCYSGDTRNESKAEYTRRTMSLK